ncbi:hypothetical protein CFOL_v3_21156 [Cephalotus follicularis]|uniref:Uncharacterized protein n=1 Tax=Cephalotus follicularis TaxID=3775 RepID=A0A1Q3CBS5_CEPFO|nr:hypothetical protein CFOL_v3_21156 [Cephalotus follicularis]
MEETKKRQDHDVINGDISGKKQRLTETLGDVDGGNFGEEILAWLSVDDETVGELMKLLETTTSTAANNHQTPTTTAATRVKFINDPYSSLLISHSSSSYITINGNEETCGSSFSDSESSLMASVDMGGIVKFVNGGLSSGGWDPNQSAASGGVLVEESGAGFDSGMDGCDGSDWDFDWDDDTLAAFLGDDLF